METSVNLNVAVTYLLSKRKQTLIASLGVTFGVSMFILMNSLISGTNDYFEEVTFSATPHIRLYNPEQVSEADMLERYLPDGSIKLIRNPQLVLSDHRLHDPASIVKALRKNAAVTALSPLVTGDVLYSNGSVEKSGIVSGTEILEQDKMFDITSTLVAGTVNALASTSDGIIIGAALAADLHLNFGDFITLTTTLGTRKRLRIVAIFKTTIKTVDETKSYANVATVQQLLKKDRSFITDLYVNIRTYNQADAISRMLANQTGYKAESWQSANEQYIAGRMIRDVITNSIVVTILIVAGFGIYNILNMMIYEKLKEIAILKAVGFRGQDIVAVFLYQAFFIGLIGNASGLILGWVMATAGAHVYIGKGMLLYLPMSFAMRFYIEGFLFGLITCLAAGYMPALKASRVDPVTIIRG